MRVVIQRVLSAAVEIGGEEVAAIGRGLLLFLAVAPGDEDSHSQWVIDKILNMRIFDGADGFMSRSLKEMGGEILVVSQFTLYANLRKGRRPSFSEAAPPMEALAVYQRFVELLRLIWPPTQTGVFGADMRVTLENDGPVTLILDYPQSD